MNPETTAPPVNMLADVREFMGAIEQDCPPSPCIPPAAVRILRRALIVEEVGAELIPALHADDLVEIADALADGIYVLIGCALAYGIDLAPIWAEVHRTNMAKIEGGKMGPDGKFVKPADWTPPNIARLLAEQHAEPRNGAID